MAFFVGGQLMLTVIGVLVVTGAAIFIGTLAIVWCGILVAG
jgi:hypothetical protein